MIVRLLREPLLHFLLIGVALFTLYRAVNPDAATSPREIVVTAARVEALAANFAAIWMRPPTAAELRGLVDDWIADEVYAREAMALGLDRDDTVIRRRLRQKMEFLSDDSAAPAEATDAQLQEFLAAHPEPFALPPRVSFEQITFRADRRGDAARRDAEHLLAALRAGRGPADPAMAGDPTMLPPAMRGASARDVENAFGSEFAAQLAEAPAGQWTGPLASGFGQHVVRVNRRDPGATPPLAEIRAAVLREWQADRRRQTRRAVLAALRARYDVRIE